MALEETNSLLDSYLGRSQAFDNEVAINDRGFLNETTSHTEILYDTAAFAYGIIRERNGSIDWSFRLFGCSSQSNYSITGYAFHKLEDPEHFRKSLDTQLSHIDKLAHELQNMRQQILTLADESSARIREFELQEKQLELSI